MIPKGFHRVSKREHCPICDRPDWCLRANDGESAICARVESKTRCGEAGWLHKIGAQVVTYEFHPRKDEPMKIIDAPSILRAFMQDTTTTRLATLSASIGVGIESLRRICAVWAAPHKAWAFPMKTATGVPVGIRLRTMGGRKFAVKGSKDGLFIPDRLGGAGPLLICEGPTETAAVLDLGFDAIGRPSCNSGTKQILEYLRSAKREVVVAANYDEAKHRPDGSIFYPGQQGAESLAELIFRPTKIVYPLRAKDFRDWINDGATRSAIESMIANTRYFRRKQAG